MLNALLRQYGTKAGIESKATCITRGSRGGNVSGHVFTEALMRFRVMQYAQLSELIDLAPQKMIPMTSESFRVV